MRRIIALIIVVLFLVVDGLAWTAAYRAANAPSPEELQLQAGATPIAATSLVEKRGDGLYEEVSLNGEWRYKQTGSELNPPSPSAGGDGGEGYFSPDLDVTAWHTMTIPLNWYLAGLNYHGVIWFRREFQADEAWRGRAVRLRFDGVDYFADVWLNGKPLGRHTGYFQPFTFDVAESLNYGGNNVLVVRVDSPYEEYDTAWYHHKTLIKGIFEHFEARPGGGLSRAGQDYNTGGLWNDVTLAVSDYATVDNLQLRAAWPQGIADGAAATLTATAVLNNYADASADVTVALALTPRNFAGDETHTLSQTLTLAPGQTTVELSGTIPNPRLWWPWDRGEPNLYTARLIVYAAGQALAEHEAAFGFREIRVDENWNWTINGQRFFPRGSNYVSTQWLAETDKEWFLRDVQLMREANLNFVRVYAHVEPVEFYEAADELGVLVWQDFPLQWGYTDAPEFVDEALRQQQDMIGLLYNHPSIAVWCGHNESPWASPWMANLVRNYDSRQNRRLDELLYGQAQEMDPSRYAHINSGTGDAHAYPGWDSGTWWDFRDLPGAPFITEYGAQALPNLRTMQRMFTPLELEYQSGAVAERWEFHDFQSNETFNVARIERGQGIGAFVADSQAYQVNLIQFATETYRRAKYDPVQGIFHFMFVDDWPSITTSVVDYYRQPKQGYYALQTAMQPILPSIAASRPARLERRYWVYERSGQFYASVWIVNDTLAEYRNTQLHWRIEDLMRRPLHSGTAVVGVPSDGVRWAVTLYGLDLDPGYYHLRVELVSAEGDELGHNQLDFRIEPPPVEEVEEEQP
jgi:beta-mannosidase